MAVLESLYIFLLPLFFMVAFLHSSVGLAGGSSYSAIMAISGVPLPLVPSISLSLNTLVSSIGARNFIKHHHFSFRLWWPFQVAAVPFVHLGARMQLPALLFYSLLFITVLLSLIKMNAQKPLLIKHRFSPQQARILSLCTGALLGFLSGSIGIGGGVYLVPAILLLGLGTIKQAAAVGVVFILLNSVIGLLTKWQLDQLNLATLWPVLLAVASGGALGSWLGAKHCHAAQLRCFLKLVMAIVCLLLAHKIWLLA